MSYFDEAVEYTLTKEGVFSDDRNDRGGPTRHGVIAATLAEYQRRTGRLPGRTVQSLTRDEAIAIYRELFWFYDGIVNRAVAIKLFDYGVNTGPTQAIRFAQRAAGLLGSMVVVDGKWGPATMTAINRVVAAKGWKAMLKAMCYYAAKYYIGIVDADSTQLDFVDGWLGRAASRP